LIVITRAGLLDFRLGLVELRLAKLDDRAQSLVTAGLSQFHGLRRLLEQLVGNRQALVGGIGVEPRSAHVADHPVLQIAQVLLLRLRSCGGFRAQRRL